MRRPGELAMRAYRIPSVFKYSAVTTTASLCHLRRPRTPRFEWTPRIATRSRPTQCTMASVLFIHTQPTSIESNRTCGYPTTTSVASRPTTSPRFIPPVLSPPNTLLRITPPVFSPPGVIGISHLQYDRSSNLSTSPARTNGNITGAWSPCL